MLTFLLAIPSCFHRARPRSESLPSISASEWAAVGWARRGRRSRLDRPGDVLEGVSGEAEEREEAGDLNVFMYVVLERY